MTNVKESRGDVVSIAMEGTCIAHCIGSDVHIEHGVAKSIDDAFHIHDDLVALSSSGALAVGNVIELRRRTPSGRVISIFNIVTKPTSKDLPTYASMRVGLGRLRLAIDEYARGYGRFEIAEIAMPRIGCGIDRLDWNTVKKMIVESMAGCKTTISVFVL